VACHQRRENCLRYNSNNHTQLTQVHSYSSLFHDSDVVFLQLVVKLYMQMQKFQNGRWNMPVQLKYFSSCSLPFPTSHLLIVTDKMHSILHALRRSTIAISSLFWIRAFVSQNLWQLECLFRSFNVKIGNEEKFNMKCTKIMYTFIARHSVTLCVRIFLNIRECRMSLSFFFSNSVNIW